MARTAVTLRQAYDTLVRNGDFDYSPSFTAATNTVGKWIDGTSGGSDTAKQWGWAVIAKSGTASARFDTSTTYSGSASIKLSTTATASSIRVSNVPFTNYGYIQDTGIKVNPSTQYRMTFRVKTNVVSGAATTGAVIVIIERSGNSSGSPGNVSSANYNTTVDWTLVTLDFTTSATTAYITPDIQLVGNNGTSTLIMDAWFDSLKIEPYPTPMTRTASSYRLGLQNMGTAISCNGSSTKVSITSVAAQNSLTTATISFWMYMTGYGGGGFGRIFAKGGAAVGYLDVSVNSGNKSMLFSTDYATTDLVREIYIPSLNEWHFVTVTTDGTTTATNTHIYIDNTEPGYRTSTDGSGSRVADTTAMAIGNRTTDTARAFQGYIDELCVWNRQLTTSERGDLYALGTKPSSGLVATYLFDEGSGTTATDATGNANGTIANGAYVSSKPYTRSAVV